MSSFLSENNPVEVQIGALVYTNVVSVAVKPQAVGGGDMVSSQTVANVHEGVAFTFHAKETVVVVSLDAQNVMQQLVANGNINLVGENAVLGTFTVKYKNNVGLVQTATFQGGRCMVKSCEVKLVQKENPVTEIEILCQGTVSFSSFA